MAQKVEVALASVSFVASYSSTLSTSRATQVLAEVPALVLSIQLVASVLFITMSRAFPLTRGENITVENMLPFLPFIGARLACYAAYDVGADRTLTPWAFQACAPLVTCLLETIGSTREKPSLRTIASLAGVAIGAVTYVCMDEEQLQWRSAGAYCVMVLQMGVLCGDVLYGKRLVGCTRLSPLAWGATWYTNLLSIPPTLLLAICRAEFQTLDTLHADATSIGYIWILCVLGLFTSWWSWQCREKTSATTYALLCVACQLFVRLPGPLHWEKDLSMTRMPWLLLCLLSGCFYCEAACKRPRELLSSLSAELVAIPFGSGDGCPADSCLASCLEAGAAGSDGAAGRDSIEDILVERGWVIEDRPNISPALRLK
eukprot:TRINITY_DN32244_c0_g1_i3.p1 TRINITY_DN32244_c0_g1~~TRINITY_DN32244_c0_g1_i3.p1  ORF type:complete len:373 (+),score=41.85 TRINITY_DN32244_c0_g1_i3:75-1193(+)